MDEVAEIREVINTFLQQRLQPKLDKLNEGDEEKRRNLIADHRPEAWIADAARQACRIQQVTHALKYSHPNAKGSSLNQPGNEAAGPLIVGTHSLGDNLQTDVVCDAKYLGVYKFLKLEVAGRSLLQRALDGDQALQQALSCEPEQARMWMRAFAALPEDKGVPASHKLAKQLYWPLGDGGYHLLAPLFPTSLVHRVHGWIREDRFSERARAAREARRAQKNHPEGYREYPELAIRNFGGTKPQNISQLNSERYGENYLLRSCPPNWESAELRPPFHVDSIFTRWFERRYRVRQLLKQARGFLQRVHTQNNREIREQRATLIGELIGELLQFAAELQQLEPGWSADERCKLNREEQCWLDPERSRQDESFVQQLRHGEWIDAVCARFARWLNARLVSDALPMGDAEYHQWHRELHQELSLIRREVTDHD